jgi:CBS domain-containing protein
MNCETVDEGASLRGAFESMRKRQCATMPVVSGGRVVGLLTLEILSEMIMVHAAMEDQGAVHPSTAGSETNLYERHSV